MLAGQVSTSYSQPADKGNMHYVGIHKESPKMKHFWFFLLHSRLKERKTGLTSIQRLDHFQMKVVLDEIEIDFHMYRSHEKRLVSLTVSWCDGC